MTTPMPAVNPVMTGSGYEANDPAELGESERDEHQARHERGDLQAVDAVLAVIPARITTNAPVGPAIWRWLPPEEETRRPAMIAV